METTAYKAVEGIGLAEGLCISIAKTITILETFDLNQLPTFNHFLDSAESIEYSPPIVLPLSDKTCEINLHDLSCVFFCSALPTRILELRENNGYTEFRLFNSSEFIFLLPEFLNHCRNFLEFQFSDKSSGEITLIKIDEEGGVTCSNRAKHDGDPAAIVRFTDSIGDKHQKDENWLSSKHLSFAQSHQLALQHGLEVTEQDWNSLLTNADKILVKSTDASRQGAGESTEFVDPEDKIKTT